MEIAYHPRSASHVPALALYAARALKAGRTVIEMGAGWGSTPMLAALTQALGGKVVTLETEKEWFHWARTVIAPVTHTVCQRMDKGWDLTKEPLYGLGPDVALVLVDHGNAEARPRCVRQLRDLVAADCVVLAHDTEPGEEFRYRWGDCWEAWPYGRKFEQFVPHSMAVCVTEAEL